MQKISTMQTTEETIFQGQLTIGVDLGDRSSAPSTGRLMGKAMVS